MTTEENKVLVRDYLQEIWNQRIQLMTTEENKALVRRYFEEVWNKRNPEALEEFYPSPDLVEQEGPAAQELPSLDDAIDYVRQVQAAFPDLQFEINDMIAEGDQVAVRTTSRSSRQTEFKGIPAPVNVPVEVAGNVIWRIADGKIVEMKGTLGEDALERLGWLEALVSIGQVFYKYPPARCKR
jgi:predicted ester cyclase